MRHAARQVQLFEMVTTLFAYALPYSAMFNTNFELSENEFEFRHRILNF